MCHMTLEGREVPVFVGTRLVASSTRKQFVNGALLEFLGEDSPGFYSLQDLGLGTRFRATRKGIERRCRLGWALTIAGCQSQTLQGVVRVLDMGSPHFCATHLYVACSRVTDPALLECAP